LSLIVACDSLNFFEYAVCNGIGSKLYRQVWDNNDSTPNSGVVLGWQGAGNINEMN